MSCSDHPDDGQALPAETDRHAPDDPDHDAASDPFDGGPEEEWFPV